MRGMILAAGFGTRLRPLTQTTPKPLLPVAGHPMIAYPIALLRSAGIQDIVVNLHYLGGQVRSVLGDGSDYRVCLTYSQEDPILDSGGGIQKAHAFLRGDTFVVVNADTVIDLDLPAAIRLHREREAVATMVLRHDPEAARYGVIEMDAEDRIRRILGSPKKVDVPLSPYMFTGVHIFEPALFDFMPPGKFSITRDTYPAMLAAGARLFGQSFHGYWAVLDTPEGLAEGRARLARLRAIPDRLRP